MNAVIRVIISAVVGFAITFITSMLVVMQGEGMSMEMIQPIQFWLAVGGAAVGALKDIQAFLAKPVMGSNA